MAKNKIPRHLQNHTDAGRKAFSDKMKAHWADPVWRAAVLKKRKPISSEAASVNSKKRWSDPVFRAKQSESRKKKWADPAYSDKMRKAASERMAAFNRTETAKELRSVSSAANWGNQDTRHRMLVGMVTTKAETLKAAPPTEFEARCYAFLDQLGVKYDKQEPITDAYTIPDACIADRKICIYFDSEYWHSMPQNAARDDRQRSALNALGYTVLVIRCDHHARTINQQDLDAVSEALCHRS